MNNTDSYNDNISAQKDIKKNTEESVFQIYKKTQNIFENSFEYETIAKDAVARYSSEAYYERLMEIYKEKITTK